jgi:hypothetical protein
VHKLIDVVKERLVAHIPTGAARLQKQLIRRLGARAEVRDELVVRDGARRAARREESKVRRRLQRRQLDYERQRGKQDEGDGEDREALRAASDARPALDRASARSLCGRVFQL